MLYNFHKKQNAKKLGSVHATYLLDGIPKPIINGIQTNCHRVDDDKDVHMQSSPFTSSAAQQEDKVEGFAVPSRSIILARQEDFEAAKTSLETIHSMHVYSLQPNMLENLQSLSDCNRSISTTFNFEDPLVAGQQYGVIHNSRVNRRAARRPLGVAPSIAAAKEVEKAARKPYPKVPDIAKADSKTASLSSQDSNAKSEGKLVRKPPNQTSSKPPALKKDKSDIFKSFSKPKSIPKMETTESSVVESPASASQESAESQEDQHMNDVSDDEQEEDFVPENKADPKAGNARSHRAEQLRKMMDEEDEEREDIEKGAVPEASLNSVAIGNPTIQKEPTSEPAPIVSGGRRRGRRKVMRKKTTKDEEGYLVTKEEPAWESFSEDEPGPQKERPPISSAANSWGKKTSGTKSGQGNIMSFFGKK